jgi:hypothetical protein
LLSSTSRIPVGARSDYPPEDGIGPPSIGGV